MIQALEECVRSHWRDLSDRPEPRALHFLKFNWSDYPEPATPLVFLTFADDSPLPVAVIKAARIASGDAIVQREFAQLELLQDVLPEALRLVVPTPIRAWDVNERPCFLASVVPGVSELLNTWGARAAARRERAMAAAMNWSLALSTHTVTQATTLCEWLQVDGVADLRDALHERGWRDEELRALEARLVEVCDAAWPAAVVHGDFFPGNLLYEGDALSGVVDWGGSFRRAPLFVDVLTYELSFSLHALYEGRLPGRDEREQAFALKPLANARQRLGETGVDLSTGSLARFALLVAGSAAVGPAWLTRDAAASRFGTLLRIECGLLSP